MSVSSIFPRGFDGGFTDKLNVITLLLVQIHPSDLNFIGPMCSDLTEIENDVFIVHSVTQADSDKRP